MAASDYTVRGQSGFTPMGRLAVGIGNSPSSDTIINVSNFQAVSGNDLEVGMAVLIGDEVMRLDSITLPNLNVRRGCADTIPAVHAAGQRVWFFSDTAFSDEREYLATTTIGVKAMPFTVASGPVPIEYAPVAPVAFNWRAIRPYPPGDVLVNGIRFNVGPHSIVAPATDFVFTWAHRDRLLQADQLVGHTEPSIGPEPGTTYRLRVFDDTNTLVRTVDAISGTTYTYLESDFTTDLPAGAGYVLLTSMRDGFESYQAYRIDLIAAAAGGGLGDTLGENLGG